MTRKGFYTPKTIQGKSRTRIFDAKTRIGMVFLPEHKLRIFENAVLHNHLPRAGKVDKEMFDKQLAKDCDENPFLYAQ